MSETDAGSTSTWQLPAAFRLVLSVAPVQLVALIVVEVVAGLAPVSITWLTKSVLDQIGAGGSPGPTVALAIGLGCVTFALAVTRPLVRYLSTELTRRTTLGASAQLFASLVKLRYLTTLESPGFRDRLQLAEQASRSGAAQVVEATISLGQALITVVSVLIALTVLSPGLALVVLLASAPTLIAQLHLARLRAQVAWSVSGAERRELFYSDLMLDLSAAKELRLFGSGALLHRRMLDETRGIHRQQRGLDRRELIIQSSLTALAAGLTAGAVIWAVSRAITGSLTVGDVGAVIVAVGAAQAALVMGVDQIAVLTYANRLLSHYAYVVRASDQPVDAAPGAVLAPAGPVVGERGIRFEDVWFRYGPEHPWVLRGVDLTLEPGEWVAVVGRNGAGKSTVMKLLCGLYAPVRGTIRWDGIDITTLAPDELRSRIGAVFQDYMSYDLSADENIGLGAVDGSDELVVDPDRVDAAAERAGADSVLADLPDGGATLLSRIFASDEDEPGVGVPLSGGQWQRLAVARALMRYDRPLLVLDEPTAGLDPEAEGRLQDKLGAVAPDRMRLIISHRLGAIRAADRIVVLDQGSVDAAGDHDELMQSGGLYAALFERQRRGYTDDEPVEVGP